ncbi:MAG: methyltransferase domain-containing protein [Chitinophagales bacterium]|nr:methyltransferase domain-containing protein [Chitinophagales bacterium]
MIPQFLLDKINNGDKICIELGCGPNKKEGKIGIDKLALHGVDIVHDAENGLIFLPDSSIDEISSSHFLEHISNFEFLISEIHRVLKRDGLHIAVVPHFSNPYYYSDYTHKRFFGLYTFDYLADNDSALKRKVPGFYSADKFHIMERKLNFKSPFTIRHYFKQIVKKIVNLNNGIKEFYEENFCWLFPCAEIIFVMRPVK